jgi:rhamnose utilization protein RhaD (predicted bifunctional aldolase and dehydrogenase)/NAD(P)-dependent dehydrogenase (short-subunit alcohol dehydrogenase family)
MIARYADRHPADVALRVYSSRLIGRDPHLVLHGGGNTSVKTRLRDDLGDEIEVLCVKGSGSDLADLEPRGLPALRLAPLLALRKLSELSDEAMVNAQRTRMLDATAPNPSVETLLHAFLPHKFIDHSHADAILALVDQPHGERLCRELFGDRFGIVPYIMPGFAVSKLAADVYERAPRVEGLLLLKHGLFTFGDTARESYERHVRAVELAEGFARERRERNARRTPPTAAGPARSIANAATDSKPQPSAARSWLTEIAAQPSAASARPTKTDAQPSAANAGPTATNPQPSAAGVPAYAELAPILRGLLGADGRRYLLQRRDSTQITAFLAQPNLRALSQVGCATPDHVIRTKRFPLVLDLAEASGDVCGYIAKQLAVYRAEYRSYVARQSARKGIVVKPLDPDPRVLLVPGIGLITAGESDRAARICADVYEHTIAVIERAQAIDRYEVLPEDDLFDMEYWSLEQAKLGSAAARPLDGRIVYVSGAAHGIGAAIARRFAKAGAAMYLVDRDAPRLAAVAGELGAAHEVVDVADEAALRASVRHCVERFGGLDGVVSNAGIAPQAAIAECSTAELEQSFRINFYAHHWLASAAVSIMRAQASGGFLLFNASKSAWNPGPDFGPYALPKAALLALMKQYALEYGSLQIRSNALNADRIRTHLLAEADIAARAQARGLDATAYYRANLLAREVRAEDVAEAFLSLALAESTTGSVVTVDGGNIAASPR